MLTDLLQSFIFITDLWYGKETQLHVISIWQSLKLANVTTRATGQDNNENLRKLVNI